MFVRLRNSSAMMSVFILYFFYCNICYASQLCPTSILTEQHVAIVPQNFDVLKSPDSPNRLWMIWFSQRNPIFNDWLKASKANNTTETWDVRPADWEVRKMVSKLDDIWISCFYTNTSLTLVHKLPNSLSVCLVHFIDAQHVQIQGMPVIESVDCH